MHRCCCGGGRGRTFSMDSRMAYLTARWQISVMSAPEKPWVTCGGRARGGRRAAGERSAQVEPGGCRQQVKLQGRRGARATPLATAWPCSQRFF